MGLELIGSGIESGITEGSGMLLMVRNSSFSFDIYSCPANRKRA